MFSHLKKLKLQFNQTNSLNRSVKYIYAAMTHAQAFKINIVTRFLKTATYANIHGRIQRGWDRGSAPPPSEKSQKYRVFLAIPVRIP